MTFSLATRRLLSGYRKIGGVILRALATLGILLTISAVITVPLWALAHYVPQLFDLLVIVGLIVGAGTVFARRIRRSRGSRRFGAGTVLLVTALLVVAVVGSVLAVPAAGIVAVIAATGVIAWRVVPS